MNSLTEWFSALWSWGRRSTTNKPNFSSERQKYQEKNISNGNPIMTALGRHDSPSRNNLTTNFQKDILNVTWCNCSINSFNNGFNSNNSISRNIPDQNLEDNNNSVTQYLTFLEINKTTLDVIDVVLNFNNLDNLSNPLSFGNHTYRNKKNNYSDFDIILYYDNNQSYISSDNQQEIIFIKSIVTAFILGIVIISTIVGNVFVIAAILLERNLQSVANYLILSLAVADLLVACLVMPLGAIYEVANEWRMGAEMCDIWNMCDILLCSASIFNLVAIDTGQSLT